MAQASAASKTPRQGRRGAATPPADAELALLRRIAAAVAKLLAPYCEVVVHDFADLEHSIVHLEGDITNRAVGGAATDLLMQRVRAGETADDLHCYRTRGPSNAAIKSSTVFLRDGAGGCRGAFCINLDISALDALQNALHQLTRTDTGDQVSETLSDDIEHTVTQVVAQTVRTMDMRLPILGREQKIALIRRLDDKGVFQVQRAVPLLARTFGSSRATIYNYLKEARGGTTAKAARVARRAPRPAIAVPPRPGREKGLG
ncbi:MAG TPA: PAS domain-containing protein [Alphaproteobacteria bacterium]